MRRAIVSGMTAALLALASCGTPAQSPEIGRGPSRLVAAGEASQKAGAVRIVTRMTQHTAGFETPTKASGFGIMDPAEKRMKLVLEMGKSPLGDLGTMHLVLDGLVLYTKSSYMNSLFPHGNHWLKLDLGPVADKLGVDLGTLMQLDTQDPAQMLAFLRGAAQVEEVGRETVNGIETTHYRAVVEYRRVAELAPPRERDRVTSSMERLIELTGQETAPMEVWIDGDDLVRQMKSVFDMTDVDPSLGMPANKTIQFTEFVEYGVRANISVPPPSRVTDMLELIDEDLGGEWEG